VILDANLLLYAANDADPRHDHAVDLLSDVLNGPHRVGLPWHSLTAFLRISTHPRAFRSPLRPQQATDLVEQWLASPAAWVPLPTERHAEVLLGLIRRMRITGPLISDAHLAALALEHGVELWSTDGDFARFPDLGWRDPLGR